MQIGIFVLAKTVASLRSSINNYSDLSFQSYSVIIDSLSQPYLLKRKRIRSVTFYENANNSSKDTMQTILKLK